MRNHGKAEKGGITSPSFQNREEKCKDEIADACDRRRRMCSAISLLGYLGRIPRARVLCSTRHLAGPYHLPTEAKASVEARIADLADYVSCGERSYTAEQLVVLQRRY